MHLMLVKEEAQRRRQRRKYYAYLKCIEANSSRYNKNKNTEFRKYITHNPLAQAEMDGQLTGFNVHMQCVVDNFETWTGVHVAFEPQMQVGASNAGFATPIYSTTHV